jgi:gliding motility-associated-like protein
MITQIYLRTTFTIFFLFNIIATQAQDFTASLTEGCAPLHVKFSTSAVGQYSWTFGKVNNNTSNVAQPEVTYDEPGVYSVTLTVNNGNSIVKTDYIKVYAIPSPDFALTYQQGCAPVAVSFENKSTSVLHVPITSYQWIFGDGKTLTTTAIEQVSHSYTLPGDHVVTLIARNENLTGCVASRVLSDHQIIVWDIQSNFFSDDFFCEAPANVNFTNSSTGPGQLRYDWQFSDESVSTERSPVHMFTSPGTYKVKLSVSGDFGCTASTSHTINVGASAFDISADHEIICVDTEINFNVVNGQYLNSWKWDFGNENVPTTELQQRVKYKTAGIYQVTLRGSAGNCSIMLNKTIEVVALPSLAFTFTSHCNRVIKFANTSLNGAHWRWDFGDGTTSEVTNPEHTFLNAGEYKIKLHASNLPQCAVIPDVIQTIEVFENPVAAILPAEDPDCKESTLSGCAPLFVNFINNTSTGWEITSQRWEFGDGRTSMLNAPKITYATPGVYQVKLTVVAAGGCTSSVTRKVNVIDPIAAIIPSIELDKNIVCVGEIVTIKANPPSQQFLCWELEEDRVDTGNEIKFKYIKPGVHDIKLKIAGCPGARTFSKVVTVNDPTVDFGLVKYCSQSKVDGSPTAYDVDFFNKSTDKVGLIYLWDFGDGTFDSRRDPPRHTFPFKPLESISYDLSLNIIDPSTGCDVILKTAINIHEVKADFKIEDVPADNNDPLIAKQFCKNVEINFFDNSVFATSWSWDFKDIEKSKYDAQSHEQNPVKAYKTPGVYDVQLSVSDGECTATKIVRIPITIPDLDGSFEFKAESTCDELRVQFTDKSQAVPSPSKWRWDFGDGNISFDQHPLYTYKKLGTYPVSLNVGNDAGECFVPLQNGISFTNPILDFSVSRANGCLDEMLKFHETTQYTNTVRWDFGNGKLSNAFSPSVTYEKTGAFDVTMWGRDFYGCEIQLLKKSFIEITKPTADFRFDKNIKECPPLVTSFVDNSLKATEWLWDFGNGQKANAKAPINTYEYPGLYSVSLEVKDVNGCKDSKTLQDLIKLDGPSGIFTNQNITNCTNDTIKFSSTYKDAISIQWDFGDGKIETDASAEVSHVYSITGKVQPLILLRDSKGCEVIYKSSPEMIVYASPDPDFSYTPEFPFEGDQVTFQASTEGLEYSWSLPDNSNYENAVEDVILDQFGNHEVTLQITDPTVGCVKRVSKTISVQGLPDLIPNIFTPNDDELNQTFNILGLEKSSWNLVVNNRWGKTVYQNSNYNNTWTANDLATGVYFFRLQNNLRPEKYFVGSVHVVR